MKAASSRGLILNLTLALLAAFALGASHAAAAPFILSSAFAEAAEFGEDEGFDTASDESTQPGDPAVAEAFRCAGDGFCSFLPGQNPPHGSYAAATTTYGSNRARSYAALGYGDPDDENGVHDYAEASSYWADEWFADVAPWAVGQPVTLDFRIDGSWGNDGYARFLANVGTRIVPTPEPNPEDPPPFLQPDINAVGGVDFVSTRDVVIVGFPWVLIPNPDADDSNGSIDMLLSVTFVPIPGETYVIQARLLVRSSTNFDGQVSANFDSTAELVRVLVPNGVSFTSAAGATYNTQVPEPALALLVALGAGALALRRSGATARLD